MGLGVGTWDIGTGTGVGQITHCSLSHIKDHGPTFLESACDETGVGRSLRYEIFSYILYIQYLLRTRKDK